MEHPVHATSIVDTHSKSVRVMIVPTLYDNYSYIVLVNDQAIIVDPSEYKPIETELDTQGTPVAAMLITHEHHDHIGGVKKLYQK